MQDLSDIEQPEEQVIDFYRQHLLGEGWQEDDTFYRGGFKNNNLNNIFYLSSRGPAITISTYKALDRPTEVRLSIQPKSRRSRYGNSYFDHRIDRLIPNLVAPPNSYQELKSGSGGDENYNSTAMLKTDLDLSTVADHYISQIEQVWQLDDRGQTSPVAWSTWTFEDEENTRWRGLFFVYKNTAAPRQYFLLLQINLLP